MEVPQGHIVKGGEQGGGHLAAAAYKGGALRVGGLGPGGKAVAHQQVARPRLEQGDKALQQQLHAGALPPQALVPQELPALGGVEIGQREYLKGLALFLQQHRGEGVGKLGGKVDAAVAQGVFQQGHAAGAVVVAGDDADFRPQLKQLGEGFVKQGDGLHRGNLPVVHIPGDEHAAGALPLHGGEEYLPQKPALVFQKAAAVEHAAQVPV